MMIAQIQSGKLDEADKDAWNLALAKNITALNDKEKTAVMQQWGAEGLSAYVAKYVKPAGAAAKPGAVAGKPEQKPVPSRSPEEISALGERPTGVGDTLTKAASGIGSAIKYGAQRISQKNDESNAEAYERLIEQRQITDEQAADYRSLLAKYPDLQRRYNRDPKTLAKSIDAPSKNLGVSGVIASR